MKRVTTGLLALCLALGLCSCGMGDTTGIQVTTMGIHLVLPKGMENVKNDNLNADMAWRSEDIGFFTLTVEESTRTMEEEIAAHREEDDFRVMDAEDLGPILWYSLLFDGKATFSAQFQREGWEYRLFFSPGAALQDKAAAKRTFEEIIMSLKAAPGGLDRPAREIQASSPAPADPTSAPGGEVDMTFGDLILDRALFDGDVTREGPGEDSSVNGITVVFRDSHGAVECYTRERDAFDDLHSTLAFFEEGESGIEGWGEEQDALGFCLVATMELDEPNAEGSRRTIWFNALLGEDFYSVNYSPSPLAEESGEWKSWFLELFYSLTLTPEGQEKAAAEKAAATPKPTATPSPTPKPSATPSPTPAPTAKPESKERSFRLETFLQKAGCDPEDFIAADPQPFTVYVVRTGDGIVKNGKLVPLEEMDEADLGVSTVKGLDGWIRTANDKQYADEHLRYTDDPDKASVVIVLDSTSKDSGRSYNGHPNLVAYSRYHSKTAYNTRTGESISYEWHTVPGFVISLRGGQTEYYAGSDPLHDTTYQADQTDMERENDWGPGEEFNYVVTQWLLPEEE